MDGLKRKSIMYEMEQQDREESIDTYMAWFLK